MGLYNHISINNKILRCKCCLNVHKHQPYSIFFLLQRKIYTIEQKYMAYLFTIMSQNEFIYILLHYICRQSKNHSDRHIWEIYRCMEMTTDPELLLLADWTLHNFLKIVKLDMNKFVLPTNFIYIQKQACTK